MIRLHFTPGAAAAIAALLLLSVGFSLAAVGHLAGDFLAKPEKSPLAAPLSNATPISARADEERRLRMAAALFPREFGIVDAIARLAPEYGLDPELVAALVAVESSGNPRARHLRTGCVGLMQVNVPVWRRALGLDPARMLEPAYNLRVGCAILRHYLAIERGDVRRALRRYHGGKGWRYAERVMTVWWGIDGGVK